MRYVIVDLEATCWREGNLAEQMEIIEIGAVLLESSTGPILGEFAAFVRPIIFPKLSDFCTQLTSIQQADVDQAEDFRGVFAQFLEWIGEEPYWLCSWGAYDLRQFRQDCARHQIPFPASFENHINLKQEFSRWQGGKQMGMKAALERMHLPLEGTHHRGIDDARNIAQLALLILPQIHQQPR